MDPALRVAKSAIARGDNLITYGYPIHPYPPHPPLSTPIHPYPPLSTPSRPTTYHTHSDCTCLVGCAGGCCQVAGWADRKKLKKPPPSHGL